MRLDLRHVKEPGCHTGSQNLEVRSRYPTQRSVIYRIQEGGMALLRNAASLGWPMKGFPKGFDPAAFEVLLQLAELELA